MANATVFDSTATNPGGTGSTITVTLSTHAVGDIIYISIGNTGNTLWTGNPAGWNRITQQQVGTATNGLLGTWFWRKIVSGDTLPLANPVFTLGATVTREAFARTIRGADLEGPFTLPEYAARAYSTGTANPVRPGAITTPAPEGLIILDYFQRAATNAPDQSGYTQDEEIVISGTLVGNATQKTVADQQTALTNQDASPTSGVRWVAGIVCFPSPDYPYYRAGTQAFNASATNVTPVLPTGTSSSDNRGNKDLILLTAQCAGADPTLNTPADWTEIPALSGTTSGDTRTRKWWTLYDGTLDRQVNRSGAGEILAYLSTYRNADQTTPIGNTGAQVNASSTSGTWPALTRTSTKSTVQLTCIAEGTQTFTTPAGWTERNDSQGVVCADQSFDAIATVNSGSFTLSAASPNVAGVVEIRSVASVGSPSVSPSLSPSASESPSVSPSASVSPSSSASPSLSPSASVSPSSSVSPSGPPATDINFRSTAGFVTDGEGQTHCRNGGGGNGELYPTTRDGRTFGWDVAFTEIRDRDSGVDPRFAGIHFATAPNPCTFRYNLDAPGTYDIRLSFGDAAGNTHTAYFELYDDDTLLTSQGETTILGGRYMDATGVVRTSIADWITNNARFQATFSTSILRLKIGFASGSNLTTLTHLSVIEATPSSSPSPSVSPSASTSPSASASPSISPSASVSPSASESPSVSPSSSLSPSPSASPSEGMTSGTVTWGHVDGVLEDNVRTFANNWTGTGSTSNTGNAELLCVSAGEFMESEIVETGVESIELLQNVYATGDEILLKYRHGATVEDCEAASWITYSDSFVSLGFVQVRVESTL